MPDPAYGWAVSFIQVGLLGASCFSFYRLGVRVGRDRQRVLTSRLGHGFLPAPSALLNDPATITAHQERRDSSGFCSDCGAAPKTVMCCKPQCVAVLNELITS